MKSLTTQLAGKGLSIAPAGGKQILDDSIFNEVGGAKNQFEVRWFGKIFGRIRF